MISFKCVSPVSIKIEFIIKCITIRHVTNRINKSLQKLFLIIMLQSDGRRYGTQNKLMEKTHIFKCMHCVNNLTAETVMRLKTPYNKKNEFGVI